MSEPLLGRLLFCIFRSSIKSKIKVMNKLTLLTTLVSLLYFGALKYFSTHTMDAADFVIMVFATMFFGAWMIAAIVVADELTKQEDKKSC